MYGIVSLIVLITVIHSGLGSPINGLLTKIETKCFETVTYYNSNGRVARSSKSYLAYDNDNFKRLTFSLNCEPTEQGFSSIQIDEVNLLLPAEEEHYCDDQKDTSHKTCTSHSPCNCCKLPNKVCKSPAKQDYAHCNRKDECELEVVSEFLENCTGRDYDCDYEKCHSRWAEVKYSCLLADTTPATVENADKVGKINTEALMPQSMGQGDTNGLKDLVIGFGAAVLSLLGVLVLLSLYICGSVRRLERKNRSCSMLPET